MRKALLTLLAFGALAVAASPAAATTKTLVGTVGPGYTITFMLNGATLKTIKAGTYKWVVDDKSSMHNFSIDGPGVEQDLTSVGFVGRKSGTFKLTKGLYTYECTPHQAVMKGTFNVT
ncbi:MAG: cupredoxin domain-containing protein [Gaiellales bacterium]